MRKEIRFAGFGGQGIIRAGLLVAIAASIYGDRNAVQTQSYGPESRGGHCKSEVVISDSEIDFQKVIKPDVLVVMSQEAYDEYVDDLKPGGVLLVDSDMVPKQKETPKAKVFQVPATHVAEQLGKTIVANVVMLGALTAVASIVKAEEMKQSLLGNIPKGTEKINLEAFESGYEHGKKLLEASH